MGNLKGTFLSPKNAAGDVTFTLTAAEPVSNATNSLLLRRVIGQNDGQENNTKTVTLHRIEKTTTVGQDYFEFFEKFPQLKRGSEGQ